jgi:hypothetical protein
MNLPNFADVPGDKKHDHGSPILRALRTDKRKVYALGGLHYLKGNSAPHFTLTIASWRRERGHWQEDSFGCAHDELLKLWPDLAPLAALHLSDWPSGAPMHAAANGLYWLNGYAGGLGERYHGGNSEPARSADDCLRVWQEHMRLDPAKAREHADTILRDAHAKALADARAEGFAGVAGGIQQLAPPYLRRAVKALHAAFTDQQRERWAREAEACIVELRDVDGRECQYYFGDRMQITA